MGEDHPRFVKMVIKYINTARLNGPRGPSDFARLENELCSKTNSEYGGRERRSDRQRYAGGCRGEAAFLLVVGVEVLSLIR